MQLPKKERTINNDEAHGIYKQSCIVYLPIKTAHTGILSTQCMCTYKKRTYKLSLNMKLFALRLYSENLFSVPMDRLEF